MSRKRVSIVLENSRNSCSRHKTLLIAEKDTLRYSSKQFAFLMFSVRGIIKSSVYRLVFTPRGARACSMLDVPQHARGAMQQSDTRRKTCKSRLVKAKKKKKTKRKKNMYSSSLGWLSAAHKLDTLVYKHSFLTWPIFDTAAAVSFIYIRKRARVF